MKNNILLAFLLGSVSIMHAMKENTINNNSQAEYASLLSETMVAQAANRANLSHAIDDSPEAADEQASTLHEKEEYVSEGEEHISDRQEEEKIARIKERNTIPRLKRELTEQEKEKLREQANKLVESYNGVVKSIASAMAHQETSFDRVTQPLDSAIFAYKLYYSAWAIAIFSGLVYGASSFYASYMS